MEKRGIILLKACKELLEQQESSPFCALDLLYEIVHYDNVDCDGSCLLHNIRQFLTEIEENKKE